MAEADSVDFGQGHSCPDACYEVRLPFSMSGIATLPRFVRVSFWLRLSPSVSKWSNHFKEVWRLRRCGSSQAEVASTSAPPKTLAALIGRARSSLRERPLLNTPAERRNT